jgi:hypothetical protein
VDVVPSTPPKWRKGVIKAKKVDKMNKNNESMIQAQVHAT